MLCMTVGQNMMLHKRTGNYKYLLTDSLGNSDRLGQFGPLEGMTDITEILHSTDTKKKKKKVGMLLCTVMLLPIFGRGSSEFSGYHRDFCLSLFPWFTLCYPASLVEDQAFTPWGRWH